MSEYEKWQDIDFSAMDGDDTVDTTLCAQLDENGLLVICNSSDGTFPSDIYGTEVFLGIFLAFVAFSGAIAAVIMYCSRRSEQGQRARLAAVQDERIQALPKKVESKPWSAGFGSTRTERMDSLRNESEEDDISSGSSISHQLSNEPVNATSRTYGQKDGSVCSLCSETLEEGQPVCQSNNPRCLHWQHKACMSKWLQFQNTCPTCNQPYVILQPETV